MKFTEILIKTLKEPPKDEESLNAQLLIRAGFIDKLMAGVYTYLPLGLRVINKISDLIRTKLNSIGAIELLMPSLHPKLNYEMTNRWENMDSLMRFTTYWTKSEYALGATHEEIIVPLMKKYIQSYKDLPQYIYQIQNKFRDEKRAKSGILRCREFFMKDLYSFHIDENDLNDYYEKVKNTYFDIFDTVNIIDKTYLTFASGGSFSKFSHEFQTECNAGEDIIYVCDDCKIAINKEIIDEQNTCPQCGKKDLRETKSIEVGNIFKLKDKFSAPFDLYFTDENGNKKNVIMGCYGIGIGRLMGTVVEILSDKNGIIWPKSIAPFDIHLIGLNLDDEDIRKKINDIYIKLSSKYDVLYDDRINTTAGSKFADADLIGCPIRIVISKNTLLENKYEIKKRNSKDVFLYDINNIMNNIINIETNTENN